MTKDTIHEIELDEQKQNTEGQAVIPMDISLIQDVDVELTAQIGTSTLSVKRLFDLKKGSQLSLNEEVNSPINLFIDNKLIAVGNLIAIDENFGIEITEIKNQ